MDLAKAVGFRGGLRRSASVESMLKKGVGGLRSNSRPRADRSNSRKDSRKDSSWDKKRDDDDDLESSEAEGNGLSRQPSLGCGASRFARAFSRDRHQGARDRSNGRGQPCAYPGPPMQV